MERTMSVEEKIRRAEAIYERRKGKDQGQITTINVTREKKDIKLLKKLIVQIIICSSIYLVIYTIQNGEYVFSKDFINQVNSILSYDINFGEIYGNIKNQITSWFPAQNGIGGAEEETTEEVENQTEQNQVQTQETEQEQNQEQEGEVVLTQEEQDIKTAKETTTYIKPVEGVISSSYGRRDDATGTVPKNHTGTDIAANLGTKILSATDGEVVLSSEEGDYGKHLKIQIGEVSIIYAHCNNLYVKQGDIVKQGQEIAEVGSTGNSTGPHLHFEIRVSERTVNPQNILEL